MSQLALPEILAAIANHPGEVDIQAKGLIVLGVLGQVRCPPAAVDSAGPDLSAAGAALRPVMCPAD